MISNKIFDFYEESRKYPRIKIKIPVQITTAAGQTILAKIHDVSPDGLQIRCKKEAALMLNPGGMDLVQENYVRAVFCLPIAGEQKKIIVSCKVYYVTTVPYVAKEERFAIGLNFKKFEARTIKYIGRYILDELKLASE